MTDFTRSPSQLRPLFRAEQVRELDKITIEKAGIPSIRLMKSAGRAVFEQLTQRWPTLGSLIVCCGSGNNAGDGYIVAALAAQKRIPVKVLSVAPVEKLTGDALRACQFAQAEQVEIIVPDSWQASLASAPEGAVIVDALLGTGLKGEVREDYQQAIQAINLSATKVISADIPSGLCSDSGRVLGVAVKADVTVTFIGVKRGLLTASAPAHSGEIIFADLGVSGFSKQPSLVDAYGEIKPDAYQVDRQTYIDRLKPRPADAHKGLFGHVLIIGGDIGYGGAPAMAAQACARSGAGLTSVATQPQHVSAVLSRLPEVMVMGVTSGQELEPVLARPSVIVVGPGLGRSPWSEQMLQQTLATSMPLVVDADGLNILAQGRISAQRDDWVLTPHPGEAARLLNMSIEQVQADRFSAARRIRQAYGGVVVLKGAGTVIASETHTLVAKVGNPGMAAAGMGDILAGVIGALLGQGLTPLEAAALAVCAHGDAADIAVAACGERGLLATDLIPHIRTLLNA